MSDLSPSDSFGQLELEQEVRRDRLGTVWHVSDRASGAPLDLRVLPESASSAATPLRIAIDKLAGLAHKRLVGIVRLEEDAGGFGIVQERGEGEPLPARRARRTRPYFEVSEVKPWAKSLLESLSYLHQNGVVHGALHPGAIFVDGPEIQIADLGLHALMESGDDGIFPIPLATVAPDVLAGASPEPEDDVYALAAVIYELLTGRAVFHSGDIGSQIESIAPPTVTQRRSELGIEGAPVPAAWETWLSAALSKNREGRPGLLDLLAAMAPTLSGSATTPARAAGTATPLAAGVANAAAGAKQFLATALDKVSPILADPKRRLVAGSIIGIAVLCLALIFRGGDPDSADQEPARGVVLRSEFDKVVASELAQNVKPEVLAEAWRTFLTKHKKSENVADPQLGELLAAADRQLARWDAETKRLAEAKAKEANSQQQALMDDFIADFNSAQETAKDTEDLDGREAAWQAFLAKYGAHPEVQAKRGMKDTLMDARAALAKVDIDRKKLAKLAAAHVREMRQATGTMNSLLDNAETTAAEKMAAAQQFLTKFGDEAPQGSSTDLAEEALELITAARREVEQYREAAVAATPESPLTVPELFARSEYGAESYSENGRKHVLKAAQTKMKDVGFYDGTPDGTPGGKTHAALIAYQQSQQLAPTAALDTATLTSLGLVAIPDNTTSLVASTPRKAPVKTSYGGSYRPKPKPKPKPEEKSKVGKVVVGAKDGIKKGAKGFWRKVREVKNGD